jgi:hypothetical protein
MGDDRPNAGARTHPEGDASAVDGEGRGGAAAELGIWASGDQRAMGHADRRETGDGAEVDGEARPAGMIDARGVDEEYIREDVEGADGSGEDRSFSLCQQSRGVGRRDALADHLLTEDVVGATWRTVWPGSAQVTVDGATIGLRGRRGRPHHGGGPRLIAGMARTRFAPSKGDEAPSDERSRHEVPRIGAEDGLGPPPEEPLHFDELLVARRPPEGLPSHRFIMAAARAA